MKMKEIKRRALSLLLTLAMVFTLVPTAVFAESTEISISTASELIAFVTACNDGTYSSVNLPNVTQTADIDLEGSSWTSINSFYGTYNGNGYTIKNMKTGSGAEGNATTFVGGNYGTIQNLSFDGASVFNNADNGSAVIVGTNNGVGIVENCSVMNSTIQIGNYEGLASVVGKNLEGATVRNCSAINNTFRRRYGAGSKDAGGIVQINQGTVENCIAYGCNTYTNCDTFGGIVATGNSPVNSFYYSTQTMNSTVDGVAKTTDEFSSGAVAWLLNGESSTNTVWYQNLDNEQASDSYPVLNSSHGIVYYGYTSCTSSMTYSNTTLSTTPNHSWENSKCTVCGIECSHPSYTNGNCDVCGLSFMTEPEMKGDYYIINDLHNYYWFVNEVNSGKTGLNAILMADIDFGGLELEPIVPSATFSYDASTVDETTDKSFSGTFDGNGHTLSNFVIKKDETQLTSGLFGAVSGTVKHLGVENASFDNNGDYDGRFGGICGLLVTGGTIENCYIINSNINTVSKIAGAVCGANYGGTVINCYEMNNTVTGHSRIGNLIGDNENDSGALVGTAKNCYSDTKVVGTNGGNTEGCAVKTAAQFASDVCYYLNNGVTDGTQIWYQNIDNGETPDSSPKFTGGTVYGIGSNTDGILLYINNVKVTDDNKDNILGDDNATVKFDSTTKTLTLNSANITANTQVTGIKSIGNLTIEVIGDNSVTGGTGYGSVGWAGGNTGDPAISVIGTLTLKGDGTLTATGGNGGAASGTGGGGADAIKTTVGLIIEGGSLIASGGKAYVGASNTSPDGKGINGSLTLKGGSVVAKGSVALTTAPVIEGLYKWRTTENGEYTGSKKQEYTYAESAYTELASIEVITGDVDSNGTVDKADSAIILKYASEIITEAEVPNFSVADVNGDGVVNILDSIAILNK